MKKRFLFLFIPLLTLACCSNIKSREVEYSEEEVRDAVEEALNEVPIEVLPYEENLEPLELLDKIEQETAESLVNFNRGDKDQYISVVGTDYEDGEAPIASCGEYNPTSSDVVLADENDNEIDLETINNSEGKLTLKVPVSKFDENHGYHVKLKNDNVKFFTKDESIRQITYYSLNVDDSNKAHTILMNNVSIKSFDVDKVDYFDVDAYGAYFIYKEPFDIDSSIIDETGMKFRLTDLKAEKDNLDTVYGKLISNQKNPNGDGYLIRYEPCKGNDIYSALNVNDSITLDSSNSDISEQQENDVSLAEQLGKAFATHEDTITAVEGLFNHYKVTPKNMIPNLINWASKIQISFSLGWNDSTSTFTWGCVATLTFNPESNISIALKLNYKQTIRYKVDCSLSIDYWGIIPTGVNYTLKVTEDDTKEVEFGVNFSTNLAPYDEQKVQEAIEKDLEKSFRNAADVRSKFKGDGGSSTSDGRSYPILAVDCYYFWPLDIRFQINFYWKCQLTLETTVKYTSHSQRVDVSMSNEKGCDPHSETKAVSDKSVVLNFMGTFHAEIGLKVSLGIGICGLYRFFHAEVFIAAYGAVDAQGFIILGITWGSDKETTFNGAYGGKFEVSIGVKWGVDIALLFGGFKFDWPIAKLVLIGFAHDAAINSFNDEESSIELTDQDFGKTIDLDTYHLLGVVIYDAKNFGSAHMDMKHDDSSKVRYGAWLSEKTEKYFSFELTKGSEYIELNDYKITIKDIYGIEEFDGEIKVTVNDNYAVTYSDNVSEITKVIKIHFTNNLKQEVFVKDYYGHVSSLGTYVVGKPCKLPVPEAPRYMKFTGWKNIADGSVISYNPEDENSRIYTPQQTGEVIFEYIFEDDYYWTVVWVDGNGTAVKTEEVENGKSATPPEASERDKYMVSPQEGYEYVFIGYDISYSKITQNTVIRAQYELRRVA